MSLALVWSEGLSSVPPSCGWEAVNTVLTRDQDFREPELPEQCLACA